MYVLIEKYILINENKEYRNRAKEQQKRLLYEYHCEDIIRVYIRGGFNPLLNVLLKKNYLWGPLPLREDRKRNGIANNNIE